MPYSTQIATTSTSLTYCFYVELISNHVDEEGCQNSKIVEIRVKEFTKEAIELLIASVDEFKNYSIISFWCPVAKDEF